ncbi:hypothetical protein D3C80_1817270 [compost metagenome]
MKWSNLWSLATFLLIFKPNSVPFSLGAKMGLPFFQYECLKFSNVWTTVVDNLAEQIKNGIYILKNEMRNRHHRYSKVKALLIFGHRQALHC